MTSFKELGLRDELLSVLEDEDVETPTALQEAVIPVLRRGGNLVARASTGSGKTLGYTLGILDRIEPRGDEEEEPSGARVLILVPTDAEAERVALAIFAYVQAAALRVTVPGGRWGTPAAEAEVLVATPAAALAEVRRSMIKLSSLQAAVVDGAAAIAELEGWEALDTVLDHIPREAQRVVISSELTPEIEDLIERRVRRALRYPAEAAVPPRDAPAPTAGLGYALASERDKLDALARLIALPRQGEAAPIVFCRTDERAAALAEALTIRGFLVGALDDPDSDVAIVTAGTPRAELSDEAGEEPIRSISYDVPADETTLLARHGGDPNAVVLIEPRELPHLREIAQRARLSPLAIPIPADNDTLEREIATFREEIRRAVREEDLGAQMLVLEPLLEELDAIEIAAAASAILRHRAPAATAPVEAAEAPTVIAAEPRPLETGPPPATWARLYISVGERDGARPGDLVGAIAGEANIPGSRVGKIDIRDSFSIVEIQAEVAEKVIRVMNGTTIKGRSIRVDYDRGGDRGRKPGARGAPVRRRDRPEGLGRPPKRDRG